VKTQHKVEPRRLRQGEIWVTAVRVGSVAAERDDAREFRTGNPLHRFSVALPGVTDEGKPAVICLPADLSVPSFHQGLDDETSPSVCAPPSSARSAMSLTSGD
jgi:hypothetical protein